MSVMLRILIMVSLGLASSTTYCAGIVGAISDEYASLDKEMEGDDLSDEDLPDEVYDALDRKVEELKDLIDQELARRQNAYGKVRIVGNPQVLRKREQILQSNYLPKPLARQKQEKNQKIRPPVPPFPVSARK